MDLNRKITPDTGYVDITPFSIGYSDFSFLIWFTPLQPETKNIKTLFCYQKTNDDQKYQFSLNLTADGKLTFCCSDQSNSVSTDDYLKSIESVIYDRLNVVAIVRKHNEIRMYLNNGLSGIFKTKEIIKCYSYEADDGNSSNENQNQIYFRLGAMTNKDLKPSNEFDGTIERFIFNLEAFDESIITAFAADLANNFVTEYSQPLPTYDSQQQVFYERIDDDLPPPY
ncbi:hypothetical protein BCR36DRAFT_584606 [Piromyces finnis]|uniref:Concanavalin A-like lectin/glucanase n=1 Tax=Piromyces finnis TaxID=1754191 RepID=A0A1Y1V5S3_9FUNG|nr:hypothetical protein BCR36DRAFT_584606 [Piromyces finnis]|eukprot:ORX47909.1 hypothetical protein BCR36DRAFT_584606 [Piromyces finnis]